MRNGIETPRILSLLSYPSLSPPNSKLIEMDNKAKAHVLVVSFPLIGRTNPILQFAKRLSSKGLRVTFATTPSLAPSNGGCLSDSFPSLSVSTICDDDVEDSEPGISTDTNNIDDHIQSFRIIAERAVARLIKEQEEPEGNPIRCIIYDSSLTWALDVAREHGIYGAPFFPQSCAVSLIFRHVYRGLLSAQPLENCDVVAAPGLPLMKVDDLPTFVKDAGKHPVVEKTVMNQFENFDQADWQFFNTFDLLEKEVLDWMLIQWPRVKTVGPAIPSMFLDKRLINDKEYGLSLFDFDYDICIQWLDTKEDGSAIFISFGSIASIGEDQMQELASGIKNSNKPFLWVVKSSEQNKLPTDFKQETSEQGLVVNWCPQLAVLEHNAVGCFFTHCGWNSTLETISLGVPIVAMPQWADQPTNAFFVEEVWGVGKPVKANAEGVVEKVEIESCIREVMEGKNSAKMRLNSSKLKMEAKVSMEEGGTSDKNIDDFVAQLNCSS